MIVAGGVGHWDSDSEQQLDLAPPPSTSHSLLPALNSSQHVLIAFIIDVLYPVLLPMNRKKPPEQSFYRVATYSIRMAVQKPTMEVGEARCAAEPRVS